MHQVGPLVTLQLLYVLPALTFKNSTYFWHCFMCFMSISEQAATFVLYNIKMLGLYNRGGECLLSGTHPLLALNGHVSSVNG